MKAIALEQSVHQVNGAVVLAPCKILMEMGVQALGVYSMSISKPPSWRIYGTITSILPNFRVNFTWGTILILVGYVVLQRPSASVLLHFTSGFFFPPVACEKPNKGWANLLFFASDDKTDSQEESSKFAWLTALFIYWALLLQAVEASCRCFPKQEYYRSSINRASIYVEY